jgi:hypothetical protein
VINILLNPTNILVILIAGALFLPAGAFALHRARPRLLTKRPAIAIAGLGPFALLYWFFHNLVLGVVGFDSIYSVIIVIGCALCVGWFAGDWLRHDSRQP